MANESAQVCSFWIHFLSLAVTWRLLMDSAWEEKKNTLSGCFATDLAQLFDLSINYMISSEALTIWCY